jgi:hypothetical protein
MPPSESHDPKSFQKYDIFREEPDHQLLWLEVVTGLEEAKKRLMSLAANTHSRYRIYDSANATFIELAKKKSA